jgi:MFS transporter, DHA2 family, methylenomycin A resistance protein
MRHADQNAFQTPAGGARNRLTLPTLCAAVLIAQIDTSVVNLAGRPIGDYFGAGVGALQWVVDGYNLVYAALLLSGGLFADLIGRRRVFMAGAAVFTLASAVCAFAPSIGVLIAGRALAGLGAALLLPASLAIIRVAWTDPAERGHVLGIWTGCNGVALAIGPTLGGALLNSFGWRSIFLVVIPLGAAAFLLAPRAVPESSDPQDRHFDVVAQIFGALALASLAVAAIDSHRDPVVAIAAFVVAAVALAIFIAIERRRGAAALVPLGLFGVAEFRGATIATVGMTFGMYGMLFLLPLFWLSVGTLSPNGAGFAMTASALAYVVTSPLSGRLTQRLGSRFMTAGGVAVIGCGLLTIAATASTTATLGAEIGLALTGVGMGLATGPLMAVAVGAVPPARSGTAAALINVARMSGASIGVAVLGASFAMAEGGVPGLRIAMTLGGLAQVAAAGFAWASTRAGRTPRPTEPRRN